MKTNLLIIAIVATLVTSCTTGTQMTRTYGDDIYFSPKDVPPVSAVQENKSDRKNKPDAVNQRIVISEEQQNADGSRTRNNHIYQQNKSSNYQSYDMDNQNLAESDTTVYYNDDDSVKYVINNYYEDNDIDFAYRINRFHRPYFYDPFYYDDWAFGYYPFYTGYYGGYDPYYYGWGWGYPYYDYYSPFAWGFGGYLGYGFYNSYYNGYYDGYYGGYYGHGGGYYDTHDVARRRSTEMNLPNRQSDAYSSQGRNRTSVLKDGSYGNESNQRLPAGVSGSDSRTWNQNGHPRSRIADGSGDTEAKSATIVNNRRQGNASVTQGIRQGSSMSGNVRRAYEPSSTGRTYDQSRASRQSQNYTPSYNKPRIVSQSNYNNNTYSRSRTSASGNYDRGVVKSGSIPGQSYSAPRSSSSMRQSYQSRSSYSSGSSSSGGSYRSSGSDYGSRSRSYSSPSSGSYSSSPGGGSYNSGSSGYSGGGGGSYGGGSSGGSSGGGGGSGHRR